MEREEEREWGDWKGVGRRGGNGNLYKLIGFYIKKRMTLKEISACEKKTRHRPCDLRGFFKTQNWFWICFSILPRCMQNLEDGIAYSGTEVQVAVSLCVGPGHQTQILWEDIKGF